MRREDIERNLALLGEELEIYELREPIRLLMIGGGFMLTQIGNRDTTKDVDVFVDIEGHLWSDEYRILKSAARQVAFDNRIHLDWFSTTITDLLRLCGPVPRGKLWRKFGRSLHVYVPSKEYILAHKLLAGRPKDKEDILTLCKKLRVKTRAKAWQIVSKHITERSMIDEPKVEKTIHDLFPK